MHCSTLLIAFVGFCSILPLAMGSTSPDAGVAPDSDGEDKTKGATAIANQGSKDKAMSMNMTMPTNGSKDNANAKDSTSSSDGSSDNGPKMFPGQMVNGKCMCSSPSSPPTEKDSKPDPPLEDPPTKTPPTTTTPPTDNNSTSSATSMSGNTAFLTGFISVAVASLVV
ncbi:hypothetical protein PTTG_04880 [Puccinia triticina 1-1 BBBD Race 1]|uniref:Uncharacterized protein n=2 Tax=Puccinia triticina TaxID=208348 RepID=A0A0C4EVP4_PUCT1|nr:uncharacterized protein PtA15_11A426 [Puccinia triticina]OAV95878.1 hypothetical protein PTTG_04880 [Puccinia triticina 1-1 BBBD Race 1]WAQ89735.1 hypothetical protein PtA15_11A426 [Puccinia triticina]WAR59783.1 hypothetical protein PtB15_11B424 [Puccinia triticina]